MRTARQLGVVLLVVLLLAACAPAQTAATPEIVDVYATSATYPWLRGVYDCAPSSTVIRLSDPDTAAVSLRLGEPPALNLPSYQIGSDDVLVVVHPQTAVGALTPAQVRLLFAGTVTNWMEIGGADLPVQVWAYSPNVDVQQLFDKLVMQGQPETSLARLAVSAQDMSDSVGSIPGSVGVLPRRWKTGNTREALVVTSAPVLALVQSEPQGATRAIIHCLQSSH